MQFIDLGEIKLFDVVLIYSVNIEIEMRFEISIFLIYMVMYKKYVMYAFLSYY